jgi:glycine/D-amino acid oxidase-like deaminating enzyme
MFPGVDFRMACRWAGTFGETKDSLPYFGEIRQMPRCIFVLCFGGKSQVTMFEMTKLVSGHVKA